jgi:hypothetical protein
MWKCLAYTKYYAAIAESHLLSEMTKRGGNTVAARKIIREHYLGRFRSPWFVPPHRPSNAVTRDDAVKKITTFYQQNRERKAMRLAELQKQSTLPAHLWGSYQARRCEERSQSLASLLV